LALAIASQPMVFLRLAAEEDQRRKRQSVGENGGGHSEIDFDEFLCGNGIVQGPETEPPISIRDEAAGQSHLCRDPIDIPGPPEAFPRVVDLLELLDERFELGLRKFSRGSFHGKLLLGGAEIDHGSLWVGMQAPARPASPDRERLGRRVADQCYRMHSARFADYVSGLSA